MLRALLPALVIGLASLPALAEDSADWRFGGDAYLAGNTISASGAAVDDLFAAGRNVTATSEVRGSAHIVGQNVAVEGRVGQNLYGAGQDVDVNAAVAGNVTLMGQNLRITEPVSGNLRAMGQDIVLSAPVAGSAIIGGEEARIDAVITGDLALSVQSVDWGEAAKVAGELHVYTDDPESIAVPESVAPADKVTFHEVAAFDEVDGMPGMERPSFWQQLRGWVGGVIVVGLLGTLFAAAAPEYLAGLRARALAQPVRTGVIGFVGLSALIGSVVLLAMTGFGILLVPLSIIGAVLLGLAGYVIGTYVLGVWATGLAGRGMPDSTGERAIAAFAGAAIGALVCLVPWIGWLAVMAIFLVGAGALVARLVRLDRGLAAA
ncbi:MAG: hypothetical protein KDK10_16615 [Maritimibacter sp.]|nr:hypothetical protein [Maritimibacter sp.]